MPDEKSKSLPTIIKAHSFAVLQDPSGDVVVLILRDPNKELPSNSLELKEEEYIIVGITDLVVTFLKYVPPDTWPEDMNIFRAGIRLSDHLDA